MSKRLPSPFLFYWYFRDQEKSLGPPVQCGECPKMLGGARWTRGCHRGLPRIRGHMPARPAEGWRRGRQRPPRCRLWRCGCPQGRGCVWKQARWCLPRDRAEASRGCFQDNGDSPDVGQWGVSVAPGAGTRVRRALRALLRRTGPGGVWRGWLRVGWISKNIQTQNGPMSVEEDGSEAGRQPPCPHCFRGSLEVTEGTEETQSRGWGLLWPQDRRGRQEPRDHHSNRTGRERSDAESCANRTEVGDGTRAPGPGGWGTQPPPRVLALRDHSQSPLKVTALQASQ